MNSSHHVYRDLLTNIQQLALVADSKSYAGRLSEGATTTQLVQLEVAINQSLPVDMRSFLSEMNGEPNDSRLCLNCRFLSTTKIASVNREIAAHDSDFGTLSDFNREKNPYVDEAVSYSRQWIPVATFLDYGYVFIDPSPKYAKRPIFFFWEYSGPSMSHVFATSFLELLKAIEFKLSEPNLKWIPTIDELPRPVLH